MYSCQVDRKLGVGWGWGGGGGGGWRGGGGDLCVPCDHRVTTRARVLSDDNTARAHVLIRMTSRRASVYLKRMMVDGTLESDPTSVTRRRTARKTTRRSHVFVQKPASTRSPDDRQPHSSNAYTAHRRRWRHRGQWLVTPETSAEVDGE